MTEKEENDVDIFAASEKGEKNHEFVDSIKADDIEKEALKSKSKVEAEGSKVDVVKADWSAQFKLYNDDDDDDEITDNSELPNKVTIAAGLSEDVKENSKDFSASDVSNAANNLSEGEIQDSVEEPKKETKVLNDKTSKSNFEVDNGLCNDSKGQNFDEFSQQKVESRDEKRTVHLSKRSSRHGSRDRGRHSRSGSRKRKSRSRSVGGRRKRSRSPAGKKRRSQSRSRRRSRSRSGGRKRRSQSRGERRRRSRSRSADYKKRHQGSNEKSHHSRHKHRSRSQSKEAARQQRSGSRTLEDQKRRRRSASRGNDRDTKRRNRSRSKDKDEQLKSDVEAIKEKPRSGSLSPDKRKSPGLPDLKPDSDTHDRKHRSRSRDQLPVEQKERSSGFYDKKRKSRSRSVERSWEPHSQSGRPAYRSNGNEFKDDEFSGKSQDDSFSRNSSRNRGDRHNDFSYRNRGSNRYRNEGTENFPDFNTWQTENHPSDRYGRNWEQDGNKDWNRNRDKGDGYRNRREPWDRNRDESWNSSDRVRWESNDLEKSHENVEEMVSRSLSKIRHESEGADKPNTDDSAQEKCEGKESKISDKDRSEHSKSDRSAIPVVLSQKSKYKTGDSYDPLEPTDFDYSPHDDFRKDEYNAAPMEQSDAKRMHDPPPFTSPSPVMRLPPPSHFQTVRMTNLREPLPNLREPPPNFLGFRQDMRLPMRMPDNMMQKHPPQPQFTILGSPQRFPVKGMEHHVMVRPFQIMQRLPMHEISMDWRLVNPDVRLPLIPLEHHPSMQLGHHPQQQVAGFIRAGVPVDVLRGPPLLQSSQGPPPGVLQRHQVQLRTDHPPPLPPQMMNQHPHSTPPPPPPMPGSVLHQQHAIPTTRSLPDHHAFPPPQHVMTGAIEHRPAGFIQVGIPADASHPRSVAMTYDQPPPPPPPRSFDPRQNRPTLVDDPYKTSMSINSQAGDNSKPRKSSDLEHLGLESPPPKKSSYVKPDKAVEEKTSQKETESHADESYSPYSSSDDAMDAYTEALFEEPFQHHSPVNNNTEEVKVNEDASSSRPPVTTEVQKIISFVTDKEPANTDTNSQSSVTDSIADLSSATEQTGNVSGTNTVQTLENTIASNSSAETLNLAKTLGLFEVTDLKKVLEAAVTQNNQESKISVNEAPKPDNKVNNLSFQFIMCLIKIFFTYKFCT